MDLATVIALEIGEGHAKAVTAVARHLGEAAFWVLPRQQPYKRNLRAVAFRPRTGKRETSHESLRLVA